jgi:hypothetical protein
LPDPDEPLTVGIDGGYVHARGGFYRNLKGALGKVPENAQSESCKMTEEAKLGKVLLLYCECQPQTDLGRCRLCHHSRSSNLSGCSIVMKNIQYSYGYANKLFG